MNDAETKEAALVQITTRITKEEAALLVRIAEAERRSLSNLLAIIVTDYCNNKLADA
jgi:hypothetical protein